jgi:hypothetical protein
MSVGGYTFQELVEEGLNFQFSESEYEALFKRWLNQAQRRAVIESEIRTQETTESLSAVAGQASYGLPANFARLIDFFNSETRGLLDPLDARDYDALPPSEGRPYAYAVLGTNLTLYPTPDGPYPLTLRYWRLPADMIQPADTPEIPAQYQELLLAWALKKAYKRENDQAMAQMWEVEWEKGILKMRGEVQGDAFDGPRQVGGSWGDQHGPPIAGAWRG